MNGPTSHLRAVAMRGWVILEPGGRVPTMRRWAIVATLLVSIAMPVGVWSYANRGPSIPSNCTIGYNGEEICGLVGVP